MTMAAPTFSVVTVLGAIAALLVVLTAVNIIQQGRLTVAARTWLLIALVFAAVVAWLRGMGGAG
jgi:hypothetical protein